MRYLVALHDTQETYACTGTQTVLAGMEQLGRKGIPVGCRGGGCGVCKVRIAEGSVRTGKMSRCHVTADEEAQGVVLACKAYPQSDLQVQAVDKLARCLARHR
jgi:ferredoxin